MRLTFQLRFHTHCGQSLWLSGNHEFFGNERIEQALPLQYLDEQLWQLTVLIPQKALPDAPISYHYILRNPDGSVVHDWGAGRELNLAQAEPQELLIVDSWNHPGFYENAFYSEPFRAVLLKANHTGVRVPGPAQTTHRFRVKAPLLEGGQTLGLLGDAPALGQWNIAAPVLLNRNPQEDFLCAELDLSQASFPISYKYAVYDHARGAFVRFEDGPNRVLSDSTGPGKLTWVNDGFARLPVAHWKGAGVAIPVFSLRSERSFGVGEFSDLKLLADWCAEAGLKAIQILPVNDTIATHTWADSYPYSAISAFALHPLYLNLAEVTEGRHEARLLELEPERQRLNALESVDYQGATQAKLAFLQEVYALQWQKTFRSREYQGFLAANRDWLTPYAVFSALRDHYGTADFNQWPAHRTCTAAETTALAAPGSERFESVGFYCFLQFHLYRQLQAAAAYAHQKGVILKGDIPIGVYRHGADAWQNPELFHFHAQAGAPPDAFAAKGQNWSFPTYNWPRMEQDGFAWWRRRFAQMSRYADAFRIDHILGFFRIWSIPSNAVEGILGYFVPALPVHATEFRDRAIPFDRQRYLRPYITDAVLEEVFQDEAQSVRRQFLDADRFGHYNLRPEFSTQRKVESYFAPLESTEQNRRLRQGLYDLISNVILLEAEDSDGQQYHFRFGMPETLSFRHLEPRTQARLRDLYVDYFFRRQEAFWMQEGQRKLPALKASTRMLVCGEDLGMVPACVPEAMRQLGILGLEVQRMPKRLGQEFSRPSDALYLSVVTPSTHDMSTIRGWWSEDRAVTQKFYNQELGLPGQAPEECPGWVNETVIKQHLASPAMWSIFQLQDLLGMDEGLRRPDPAPERINIPANPKHYWRYRMHLSLEKLAQAGSFTTKLRALLEHHGRI
jgi:4-alpha-glucanotransferase